MIITNKYGLPEALVNLANDHTYEKKPKRYSVTEILNPLRSILLNRRHANEIEKDVSQMTNLIFGSAVHKIIEESDKSGCAEIYLAHEIENGYFLTGKCDLYNLETSSLEDYKTASVWKVLKSDFDDWRKQGLMYVWLFRQQGIMLEHIKFHALLKDWTERDLRLAELKGEYYPISAIWTYKLDVCERDIQFIEDFIRGKFADIMAADMLKDEDLPVCDDNDCWYTGDKWAVYKNKTSARATRLFDTEEDAKSFMEKDTTQTHLVHRKGEYRRCQDYCDCCKFCKYYEERKK